MNRTLVLLAVLWLPLGCARRGAEAKPDPRRPVAKKTSVKAAKTPRVRQLPLKVVATCAVPGDPAAINTESDVAYGAAGQKLDIAWPKAKGPHPLILLFHGGGWFSGERSNLGRETEVLAGAGYAVATVGYRLTDQPGVRFPAAVEDARCAVRWLRSQAKRYSIDPKRVVAAGTSAGGHLAMMLALAEKASGLDGGNCPAASEPVGISGAISYYGPSDLRSSRLFGPDEKETLEKLFGKNPEAAGAAATLASPITHVHAAAPPILLLHGTGDVTVPIAHARKLKAALDRAGVRALLVEVAGAGHDFPVLSNKARYLRTSCTALAFFKAILRASP